ncbi:hypothetical protein TW95_gp0314 [Pandoravirus inopinatum]|uniref:Uncharacterized protein n=1 Tax=Pandoravirus inopinatum TaxID=1605721 RepID=A0A0B5IWH0_9VIRU|nr:hypothetical protein TW95_gp0314 [Pandoravirus inopinatum]AJF97048.1 hypothetical protein [Pandoravirus inopinatum]
MRAPGQLAFTSVCFASVVAAAAVVAQAWHDRGKDAAPVPSANTYGACDAGRRDIASVLGGDRVCGRVWRGQPQSDPVVCHAAWRIDRWQGVTTTTAHFDASGADSLGAFEACGVACMRVDNGGVALAWTQTYTTLLGQCEPPKNHAAARYAFRGAMTMDADGGATIRGAWSRVETPGADTRPGDFVSGRFVLVLASPEADIELRLSFSPSYVPSVFHLPPPTCLPLGALRSHCRRLGRASRKKKADAFPLYFFFNHCQKGASVPQEGRFLSVRVNRVGFSLSARVAPHAGVVDQRVPGAFWLRARSLSHREKKR